MLATTRKRWLLTNGVDADATVLSVENTGWTRGDGLGVKVKLTVSVGARLASTRSEWVSQSAIPEPGDRIRVRHAPGDPADWAWDGESAALDVSALHPAERRDHRLRTLAAFRDSGAILPAEYDMQRAEILDEL